MAVSWGPWETAPSPGGTSGMRVGLEGTWSVPSNGSTTATLTVKVWTENYLTYSGDSQVINFSGTAGASFSDYAFSNASGTSPVLRTTKTYTYTYSTYGSSPGTRSVTATMSGVFDGTTASHTVTYTIPARPYAVPTAPSSVVPTRNSDVQATLTWVNNPTTAKPYTSHTLQMQTYTGSTWGAWVTIASPSATATSQVVTGLAANRVYHFQIRANNSVGSSAYVSGGYVYMTPGAPSNVVSAVNPAGTQITTTWTNNSYTEAQIKWTVERSVNGAAYTVLTSTLGQGTTSYTDTTPGAGTNQYRVKATEPLTGPTSSAYATGNVVSTVVPPLAPTNLSPNGVARDLANTAVLLTWQHNPGADNADQSHFTIEYSSNGGSTWTPLATNVASAVRSYTIAAGTLANGATYLWRVQTQGATLAAFGPMSAAATIIGSAKPTATILTPTATTAALPISVTWDYNQDQASPQSQWWASLFDSGMNVLQTKTSADALEAMAFDYPVVDGQTYTVQIQVRSGAGVLSDISTVVTTVALPVPAPITTTAVYEPETGATVLSLLGENPDVGVSRTNLMTNPSTLTTGAAVEARRNLTVNPSWRSTSGTIEVRRNYITSPKLTNNTGWSNVNVGGTFNSATNQAYSPNTTAAVGDKWTVSADITAGSAALTGNFGLKGTTASVFGSNTGASTPFNIPAWTTQRISCTFTVGSGADGVRLLMDTLVNHFGTGARITNVLMTKTAAQTMGYFDGSTPAADGLTYSWTGTAGASESIATGAAVTVYPFMHYTGGLCQPLGWVTGAGTYRILLRKDATPSDIIGFTALSTNGAALSPGHYHGGRVKVRVVAGGPATLDIKLAAYDAGGSIIGTGGIIATAGSTVIPADGTWVDYEIPSAAVAPALSATTRWLVYASGTTVPAGTVLEFKEAITEKLFGTGRPAGPYFDGGYGADDDLTYTWVGAAETTASIATGVAVTGVVSNGIVYKDTDNGKVWATTASGSYLYAAATGIVGRYYAAKLRVRGTPGRSVSFASTDNVVGAWSAASAQVIPDEGEMVVDFMSTNAAAGTNLNWGLSVAIQGLEMSDLLVEEVPGPGYLAGGFFTGDSADEPTSTYAWSGTANASTSVGTGRAETTATFANVERRVDGGDWVTLFTGVTLPIDVVDALPLTRGTTEYRITSVSTAPSYRVNDSVFVTPENPDTQEAGPDLQWVFVNYGDAFEKLLRFRSEPKVSENTSRVKATRSLLGRKKPVLLLGENRSRQVSAAGTLVHATVAVEDDQRLWDSPPEDWAVAGLDAEVVCFRDFTGRRVFGSLSEVQTEDERPGKASVSFNVTEIDYVERYGQEAD